MTKYEWEKELRGNLKRLPEAEIARIMDYYSELFEDKAEEGLSEREIIKRFGNPFDVAYKILYDSGADAGGEARIKPPEPFIAYGSDRSARGADAQPYGADTQQVHGAEIQGGSIPNTPPAMPAPENPEKSRRTGRIVTRLVFFIPFVIFAVVLWSLVIAFTAGGAGAILVGLARTVTGFTFVGSGMLMAVMGMGLAATGVGIVMSVGAVFLVKAAVRLTQKYFYMGKHKVNAKTKERVS